MRPTDVSSSTRPVTVRSPASQARGRPTTAARAQRERLTATLVAMLGSAADAEERQGLRHELVLTNRPVADAVAARYRERGIPLEDLQQAAYEGLIKAVDRFEPGLRNDLLTYAVPTIRGEIQRYFRDLGWMVRPPRRIQELQWRINRTTSDLRQALGRDPGRGDVTEALGIDERDYDEAQSASGAFHPTSLDRPVGADGSDGSATLADLLPGHEGGFEGVEVRVLLSRAIGVLTARERRIVYLRFWEDRMQREIGDELGITQMQVSRLLTQIADKLRAELGDEIPQAGVLPAAG